MTVRQWSDTCFAGYVGVTSRPFSGTFVGTEGSRVAAEVLVCNETRTWSHVDGRRVWDDEQARDVSPVPGQPAPPGALVTLDRRHLNHAPEQTGKAAPA